MIGKIEVQAQSEYNCDIKAARSSISCGDLVHAGALGHLRMRECQSWAARTVELGLSGTKVEAALPLEWAAVK
jgi:hypothetical protein